MICLLASENMRKEIFLIIYIFLLLFAPPFFKNINLLLILAFFSAIIIVVKYRNKIKLIIKNHYLKKGLFLIGIYYMWQVLSIFINILFGEVHIYNYIINFYSMFLVVPMTFICCIYIVFYSYDNEIDFNQLIKIIIYAGLIQSVITLLAFLFPNITETLLNIMYDNTGEKLYLNNYHTTRRFFGFANNLLDSFGFGVGILSTLPLFYSVKNGKKWLITVPFLLLVPLLNSRTGLLMFIIGFIIWIIYLFKNNLFQSYSKIFIYLFISTIFLFFITAILYPTTIGWIINDFLSFLNVKNGTANILFSKDFWTLPKLINIVIGKGILVAGFGGLKNYLGFTSDVGYINEIWKTGIVGIIIMLVLFVYIIRFIFKNVDKCYKFFAIFIFVSVLITNIKFYVYSYNPGIVVILLFFVYLAVNKVKLNNNLTGNTLISVIIPVYNVENYISRCLTSVVKQTYTNLEIILVNDGSTDNSEMICKKFEKDDLRIHYIKQSNMGLSAARNTGIKNANGKYLIFIDSDDYVNVHFVEDLYSAVVNSNADVAVCDFKKVDDRSEDIYNKEISIVEKFDDYKFDNLYNDKSTVTTVAWNKIYKKEIFDNIRYPNGRIHEDEYVITYILEQINSIAYSSSKYYYYYQRPNSITGSYSMKRLDILEALKERVQFFEKKNLKWLKSRALYDYYYQLCYQKKMMSLYFSTEKDLIQKLDILIKNIEKQFFRNIYINPFRKLKILLLFYVR